ncbi:hypothetical protein PAXINDRAFT_101878 [Paxillus involutus ATCC 200175]|uniref:Uncharacterized protein n=1 Tax=Paxillus involutus ATCC 200175 TaxID=664439 RepID=A0A0C9SS13_PAXIN|nr:hypothetical protein PAXINDRAFT_101878 [Paxillus involutus ATCC 200175]
MNSTYSCFQSLRGEIFHVVAIVFAILVFLFVVMTDLLPRLAEARDERPRRPTGRVNRPRRRPSQRADQNVVSVASSRRNFGPST